MKLNNVILQQAYENVGVNRKHSGCDRLAPETCAAVCVCVYEGTEGCLKG